MMACVIIIFNTSRVLIIVLQDASYVTAAGYCIALPDMMGVTPFTQYISIALYISTVIVQVIFTVCSGILLHSYFQCNLWLLVKITNRSLVLV